MIFGKLGPNICYRVQEHVLLPLEFVTDLGVTIDRELKFNHHVASIVSRANKSLGMILRVSKHFKDPSTYFLLYNAYVRSILEYACIIWHSDRYSTHIKVLERVQKKFLRYVYFRVHGQYPHYKTCPVRTSDMLKEFELTTLLERRQTADCIFLFKLLNGKVNSPELLRELTFNAKLRSTRNKNLFITQFSKSKLFQCSVLQRLMSTFNSLSHSLPVDPFSMSHEQFKKIISSRE